MTSIYNQNSIKNITLKPFSFISKSVETGGIFILALLSLQIIMLFFTKSFSSLVLVLFAVLASVFSELVYYFTKKKFASSFIYSIINGILVGLLLPQDYPPFAIFIITFFCFTICKYAWDGFGHSWVNPVALTVVLLYFLNPDYFKNFALDFESLKTKNPTLILIQNGTVPILSVDSKITAFLNKTVFNLFGIVIPEGYVSLFWDSGANIAAFRFNFITLISSIILLSFDMIDALIPTIFIFTYSVLVRFVLPLFLGETSISGDIFLALLTSGTLFSTLYLLQFFGTTPLSLCGKIVFAIISGILAFFIIGFGTSSCGYIFVILCMNVISPIIQYFENLAVNKKLNKVLLPKIKALKEVDNV